MKGHAYIGTRIVPSFVVGELYIRKGPGWSRLECPSSIKNMSKQVRRFASHARPKAAVSFRWMNAGARLPRRARNAATPRTPAKPNAPWNGSMAMCVAPEWRAETIERALTPDANPVSPVQIGCVCSTVRWRSTASAPLMRENLAAFPRLMLCVAMGKNRFCSRALVRNFVRGELLFRAESRRMTSSVGVGAGRSHCHTLSTANVLITPGGSAPMLLVGDSSSKRRMPELPAVALLLWYHCLISIILLTQPEAQGCMKPHCGICSR